MLLSKKKISLNIQMNFKFPQFASNITMVGRYCLRRVNVSICVLQEATHSETRTPRTILLSSLHVSLTSQKDHRKQPVPDLTFHSMKPRGYCYSKSMNILIHGIFAIVDLSTIQRNLSVSLDRQEVSATWSNGLQLQGQQTIHIPIFYQP